MKAIFLSSSADKIAEVYTEKTFCELAKLTDIEKTVYKKSDISQNPYKFSKVEFIFSTWGMFEFTENEVKEYLPSLKCVFYGAGTVQKFARPFLSSGVRVFSSWAANAVPVAEMTVAEIILANKGYYLSSRLYHKTGRKTAREAFEKCRGNYGETVGIIGAGMIGTLVIKMLKNYNLKVVVFDPFLSGNRADELGVEKCNLPELFKRAFVISNHLANNEKTRGMLDYALFELMRENAVFINTGRGAQIVEDDLALILKERKDITALLDVTDPEPPAENHPFYNLENCIMTPHIAGSSGDEVARMGEYMLSEFKAYLGKEECKYEVNEKMLETMA